MREIRNTYKILVGKLKGRDHFGDIGLAGNIILRRIFKKQDTSMCSKDITCSSVDSRDDLPSSQHRPHTDFN
jgi:hypothetical protein